MDLPAKVVDSIALLAELGAGQLKNFAMASPRVVADLSTNESGWTLELEDEDDWSAEYVASGWKVSCMVDCKRFFLEVTSPEGNKDCPEWTFLFSVRNDDVVHVRGNLSSPAGTIVLDMCKKAVAAERVRGSV